MSRRTSITIVCDHCGRASEHEMTSSGFHEQIYTMEPYPRDWLVKKRIGGSELSPVLDYCPTCKDLPHNA